MSARFTVTYIVETPLALETVAELVAGEQSCGTFVAVPGESQALRDRARATVDSIEELPAVDVPSVPSAWTERRGLAGPCRRGRIRVSFPVDNVGVNLPTFASVVSGNLYELGELTGIRLESIELPAAYRDCFDIPPHGVAGTRESAGVEDRPLIGTIIKPNVGLSAEDTGDLVGRLAEAGLDFIKDDEVCANPAHAPLEDRVRAVMKRLRRHEDATGKRVMMAFNITDETDAMRRHADFIAREGGACAMISLNWCGLSAVQSLRRSSDLVLHGHRNGYGAFSRHAWLGMDFQAYQVLWRLTGIDHLHVNGLQGKFSQPDDEVARSAKACLTPLSATHDDRVMPVFSSGQWAGTVPATWQAVPSPDLMFLAGGGIMAHPAGEAAGVASIRSAWKYTLAGRSLEDGARESAPLAEALAFFGGRT